MHRGHVSGSGRTVSRPLIRGRIIVRRRFRRIAVAHARWWSSRCAASSPHAGREVWPGTQERFGQALKIGKDKESEACVGALATSSRSNLASHVPYSSRAKVRGQCLSQCLQPVPSVPSLTTRRSEVGSPPNDGRARIGAGACPVWVHGISKILISFWNSLEIGRIGGQDTDG